jgi:hypothetical protein
VAVAHCKRLRRLDEAARPLGIFFNIHRGFPQPVETTPFGNGYAIFIGFPLIALTFVNRRPAVAPPTLGRLEADHGKGFRDTERGRFTNSCAVVPSDALALGHIEQGDRLT